MVTDKCPNGLNGLNGLNPIGPIGLICPIGLNPIGLNYSFTRVRSPSAQSLPTKRATEHQKACVGRHVARVPQHPP